MNMDGEMARRIKIYMVSAMVLCFIDIIFIGYERMEKYTVVWGVIREAQSARMRKSNSYLLE